MMKAIAQQETTFILHLLVQAKKEIEKMPSSLKEKIYFDLDDLQEFGTALKEPKVRDLGNGLKELRSSALDGIGRSFFFFHVGKHIFVVHALHKKTQKTPKKDLDLAKNRMKQLKLQLKKEGI